MSRTLISWILAASLSAAPLSTALAQTDPNLETPDEAQTEEDIGHIGTLIAAEPVYYQVTFPRFQAIVTPSFILDAFFDMHPNHWGDGQLNFAFGAEFIIRHVERFDLIFSVDWADVRTTDDWWLEADEEIVDADWVENTLSLLAADVAINWLTELDRSWELYYGVGLGVAIPLGGFLKSDIDPNCIASSGVDPYRSYDTGIVQSYCEAGNGTPILDPNSTPTEEDGIPVVLPALSLNLGTRFIIDEHWPIQLEVGFKTMYFYAALELGYIWD